MNAPGPCVLFATPGMLHGGTSLDAFEAWAGGANNLVVLPGYQVAGTLGGRLQAGQRQVMVCAMVECLVAHVCTYICCCVSECMCTCLRCEIDAYAYVFMYT